MMPTFAVLGAGGWGTAVAVLLAQKPGTASDCGAPGRRPAGELRRRPRERPAAAGGADPAEVRASPTDPAEATAGADCWVAAVPTAFLRATLTRLTPFAGRRCAGRQPDEGDRGRQPSAGRRKSSPRCSGRAGWRCVSGPSHAEEVARGLPTSVVAASPDADLAGWVQEQFGTDRFRVYTNADLVGVELAGALKNVIGIAAGHLRRAGFGDNAKAALLTRGLVEMTRFGVAHGAEPATFARAGRARRPDHHLLQPARPQPPGRGAAGAGRSAGRRAGRPAGGRGRVHRPQRLRAGRADGARRADHDRRVPASSTRASRRSTRCRTSCTRRQKGEGTFPC